MNVFVSRTVHVGQLQLFSRRAYWLWTLIIACWNDNQYAQRCYTVSSATTVAVLKEAHRNRRHHDSQITPTHLLLLLLVCLLDTEYNFQVRAGRLFEILLYSQ